MKKATTLLLVLFVFTAVGCGDSHESATEDAVGIMDEMAEILESIEDKDSAEKANDRLKDLAKDAEKIVARMEELGKPDKEMEAKLKEEFEDDIKALQKRVDAALKRILKKDATLLVKIESGMKDLTEAMKGLDDIK